MCRDGVKPLVVFVLLALVLALPAAVLVVSTVSMPGRFVSSQRRHWARGCGWEATRWMSSRRPVRDIRCCAISSLISLQIVTSVSPRASKVTVIGPSEKVV